MNKPPRYPCDVRGKALYGNKLYFINLRKKETLIIPNDPAIRIVYTLSDFTYYYKWQFLNWHEDRFKYCGYIEDFRRNK
jgi:hypothetical protein